MSKVCSITGKGPLRGNRISHSNIKTKRRFLPNLQKRRIWLAKEQRFVTVRISTKALRIIDKVGIETALAKQCK